MPLKFWASFGAALLCASSPSAQSSAAQDAKMKWFREAKFGLFIHRGLYSIPAGEWNGQPIAGLGEWIMNRAKIPVRDYEKLAPQFNPVKFNADGRQLSSQRGTDIGRNHPAAKPG